MSWLDDPARHAAAQDRSAAVARAWLGGDVRRALTAAFDLVTPGDADGAAGIAEAVLHRPDWVEALLAPLIGELRADDLFEPPLRAHRDAIRTGVILFDHAAVSIGASLLSADALASAPSPASVVVPGRLSVTRYHRAGGATLQAWEAGPLPARFDAAAAPPCRRGPDRQLHDGEVLRWDGRSRGFLLAGASADVATLTATIRYGAAALMREYRADTGALIRAAELDDAASRTTMLLTLLRLSGRRDAGDLFEAETRNPAFHRRWAAMREWLALDVEAALPRLRAMADADPDAEVRAAACATLRMAEQRLAA